MNIQKAIRAAQNGHLIRRASWKNKPHPRFNIPHRQEHIACVSSLDGRTATAPHCGDILPGRHESDTRRGWWMWRDQLPDQKESVFQMEHNFSVEEILATDWEILKNTHCSCVECTPSSDPINVGDLIEYYPCSGFRVVWCVIEITDSAYESYAYGRVYRLFDGQKELPFVIDKTKDWPTVKILQNTVYQNWIKGTQVSHKTSEILRGLSHNWPEFDKHCKLTGQYLAQLRQLESKKDG